MRFFILTLVGLSFFCQSGAVSLDSIGIEKIDGNVYVLHKVEEKETLYSLSKRYEVEISDIIKVNPASEFGLNIGEILKIPLISERVPEEDGRIVHKVKPGETLYSISREYGVSPAWTSARNSLSGKRKNSQLG
ncbi:MAG: LysM peptidoglycan-binding domain-containing protein [Cyclobacteriaceae bacterium]